MKKKKIIIIAVIVAIIIALGVTIFVFSNKGEEQKVEQANIKEEDGTSRLVELKENMQKTDNYSVELKLNDENKRTTSRKDNSAKVEIIDEGEKSTYIVKDNTTYLLVDSTKKYYEYKNTAALLNDFANKIDEMLKGNFKTGTEQIDGQEYRYEEFERTSAFLINYKGNVDDLTTKTRLYFDGNKLKYIKTYVGDVEQLLKVNFEFNNQNSNNFEIPGEYSK